MCTVSVIAAGRDVVRIACNRDEQRTRPCALAPQIRPFGRRRAVLPVDPISNGTWVAVNDAGLAAALLNVQAESSPRAKAPPASRGAIIPRLLHARSAQEACIEALRLDAGVYAPFRLVLVDDTQLFDLHFDGVSFRQQSAELRHGPRMFTSSGLGDEIVQAPRERLFAEMFESMGPAGAARLLVERQDAFHRSHWPDRPELSVCMSRADARTVSHTVIEIHRRHVELTYHPDAPDRYAEEACRRLARTTS